VPSLTRSNGENSCDERGNIKSSDSVGILCEIDSSGSCLIHLNTKLADGIATGGGRWVLSVGQCSSDYFSPKDALTFLEWRREKP
jgi:hypothetical protein